MADKILDMSGLAAYKHLGKVTNSRLKIATKPYTNR